MSLAQADINDSALADDEGDNDVNDQLNEDNQINGRVMPTVLSPDRWPVGGRVALGTPFRQQCALAGNKQVAVAPNTSKSRQDRWSGIRKNGHRDARG